MVNKKKKKKKKKIAACFHFPLGKPIWFLGSSVLTVVSGRRCSNQNVVYLFLLSRAERPKWAALQSLLQAVVVAWPLGLDADKRPFPAKKLSVLSVVDDACCVCVRMEMPVRLASGIVLCLWNSLFNPWALVPTFWFLPCKLPSGTVIVIELQTFSCYEVPCPSVTILNVRTPEFSCVVVFDVCRQQQECPQFARLHLALFAKLVLSGTCLIVETKSVFYQTSYRNLLPFFFSENNNGAHALKERSRIGWLCLSEHSSSSLVTLPSVCGQRTRTWLVIPWAIMCSGHRMGLQTDIQWKRWEGGKILRKRFLALSVGELSWCFCLARLFQDGSFAWVFFLPSHVKTSYVFSSWRQNVACGNVCAFSCEPRVIWGVRTSYDLIPRAEDIWNRNFIAGAWNAFFFSANRFFLQMWRMKWTLWVTLLRTWWKILKGSCTR